MLAGFARAFTSGPLYLQLCISLHESASGARFAGAAGELGMRRNKRHVAIRRAVLLETLELRRLLSFAPAVSYAVGTNPQAVAAADFNGDGKLDLVTANAGSNDVSVRLGNGTGGFGAAGHFATGAKPLSVAVGDFNNDGKLD